MNNKQIQILMSRYEAFQGVYPADKLPKHSTKSGSYGYIANTDSHDQPGKHWVSFFFPEQGYPEYFDSFGMVPLLPEFYEFLGNCPFKYNNVTLQAPLSSTCGQYCIFYLLGRIHGYKYNHILDVFDTNLPGKNDKLVNNFINTAFDINLSVYDYNFIGKQIARAYEPQS